jgi:hypothetical protein
MEPDFMVLGQSAATAAVQAIDQDVPIQRVDPLELRRQLLADGTILEWQPSADPPRQRGTDPEKIMGIVLDDNAAQVHGFESTSNSVANFVGTAYRHDGNADKGKQTALFKLTLPESGRYEIRISYSSHENRATNVPITIQHAAGVDTVHINQRRRPKIDNLFHSLGGYPFEVDQEYAIQISNDGTDGYVIVDAVQAIKQGSD